MSVPHATVRGNIHIFHLFSFEMHPTPKFFFIPHICINKQHVGGGGNGRGEVQLFTYTSISVNSEQPLENNTESDTGTKALSVGDSLV